MRRTFLALSVLVLSSACDKHREQADIKLLSAPDAALDAADVDAMADAFVAPTTPQLEFQDIASGVGNATDFFFLTFAHSFNHQIRGGLLNKPRSQQRSSRRLGCRHTF